MLAIADDGTGVAGGGATGTGLSIVRALVRDELRGTLELTSGPGDARRSRRFPARLPLLGVTAASRSRSSEPYVVRGTRSRHGTLWHVSEDGSIRALRAAGQTRSHDSPEALVWAIDDEHVPAYWFPRDLPRGTFWAIESTTDEDVERFLDG